MIYNISNIEEIRLIETEELFLRLKSLYDNQLYYIIYLKEGMQDIGYCDLRLGHNASLYYYGNIGYRIKEPFRGHGYAYIGLISMLQVAKKIGMDYCIITCSPENIASEKTILKAKATYLKTVRVPFWHPLARKEGIKKIYKVNLQGDNL